MHHVLNWIWQGMLVAVATSAFLRMLDRSRAATRYGLCWVALLAVLVLPLVPVFQSGSETAAGATPLDGSIVEVPNAWWTSWPVVAALGAWWLAVFALRVSGAVQRVRAARARCRPFPASVESQLVHWLALRARGRRTRLAVSDAAGTAHVLGCGAPIIAVAPALVEHLSAEELDRVVIHEWSHVQRRDDLLSLAQLGIRAIAGWHPAVWWLERQLVVEREAACDETVVVVTGSARAYASSLAKVAFLGSSRRMSLAAVGVLSSSGLTRRVMRILSRRTFLPRRWSIASAAAAMVLLAALSFSIVDVRLIGLAAPERVLEQAEATPARAVEAAVLTTTRRAPPEDNTARSARASKQPRGTAAADRSRASAQRAPIQAPSVALVELPVVPDPRQDETRTLSSKPLPLDPAVTAHATSQPPAQPAARGPSSEPGLREESSSPWGAAADAGAAIGRGSQKAGVATASFFSRIGKKIGRSF